MSPRVGPGEDEGMDMQLGRSGEAPGKEWNLGSLWGWMELRGTDEVGWAPQANGRTPADFKSQRCLFGRRRTDRCDCSMKEDVMAAVA